MPKDGEHSKTKTNNGPGPTLAELMATQPSFAILQRVDHPEAGTIYVVTARHFLRDEDLAKALLMSINKLIEEYTALDGAEVEQTQIYGKPVQTN